MAQGIAAAVDSTEAAMTTDAASTRSENERLTAELASLQATHKAANEANTLAQQQLQMKLSAAQQKVRARIAAVRGCVATSDGVACALIFHAMRVCHCECMMVTQASSLESSKSSLQLDHVSLQAKLAGLQEQLETLSK
jgi:hypothetical protein